MTKRSAHALNATRADVDARRVVRPRPPFVVKLDERRAAYHLWSEPDREVAAIVVSVVGGLQRVTQFALAPELLACMRALLLRVVELHNPEFCEAGLRGVCESCATIRWALMLTGRAERNE